MSVLAKLEAAGQALLGAVGTIGGSLSSLLGDFYYRGYT